MWIVRSKRKRSRSVRGGVWQKRDPHTAAGTRSGGVVLEEEGAPAIDKKGVKGKSVGQAKAGGGRPGKNYGGERPMSRTTVRRPGKNPLLKAGIGMG